MASCYPLACAQGWWANARSFIMKAPPATFHSISFPGDDTIIRDHHQPFTGAKVMNLRLFIFFAVLAAPFAFINTAAQDKKPKKEVIPHAQDKPPGPPLSPQEALKKM